MLGMSSAASFLSNRFFFFKIFPNVLTKKSSEILFFKFFCYFLFALSAIFGWTVLKKQGIISILFYFFLPAYFLLSFVISNDLMLVALFSCVFYLASKPGSFNSYKKLLVVSILIGLGILTKYNAFALGVALLLTLLMLPDENLKKRVLRATFVLSLIVIIISPWFIHNYVKYQKAMPSKWDNRIVLANQKTTLLSFNYFSLIAEPFKYRNYKTFFDSLNKPRENDRSVFTRLYSTFFYDSLLYTPPAPPIIPSILYALGIVFFFFVFIGLFFVFKPVFKSIFNNKDNREKIDSVSLFFAISFIIAFAQLIGFNLVYPYLKLVHAKAIFMAPYFIPMIWLFKIGFDKTVQNKKYVKLFSYLLSAMLLISMMIYDGFLLLT